MKAQQAKIDAETEIIT
jgi:hypothetical protein